MDHNSGVLPFLLAVLVFLVLLIAWVAVPRRETDEEMDALWGRCADALGLRYDPGGPTNGPTMSGRMGQMRVLVDTFGRVTAGRRETFTRVVVDSEGRIPDNASTHPTAERPRDPLEAMLARHGQRRVLDLVKHLGATLAQGKLRWARPGLIWEAADFVQTVRDAVRTAEHLCVDEADIPARLLVCVRDQRIDAAQRREMLLVLLDRYPGTNEANAAARDALRHPEPVVRLTAARALGQTGVSTLGVLGSDPAVPPEVRAQALNDLMTAWPSDVAQPQLRRVLRSPEPEIVRTAVHLIRQLHHTPAVRVLLELGADPQTPPDLLSLVVEVVGEVGDAAAEPVLLGLLRHGEVIVRRGAAIALGQIGTPEAIVSLRELMDDGLLPDARLRALCRTAIREIQGRFGIAVDAAG